MQIHTTDQQIGRTIFTGGRECLFFSGYAYLGMGHVPEYMELVKEGLNKYGLSFPSARISNTRLELFARFEQLLSVITGTEDSICFASGFTSGQVATKLWSDQIYNAPASHPAISRTDKPAMSFSEWAASIQPNDERLRGKILAADTVNILKADLHDFSFLEKMSEPQTCIIDDSHGFCVIGNNGQGVHDYLPPHHHYILAYSLSKGANLVGGAISGPKALVDQFRTSPDYAASTSIAPAYMHAFIHGQHLYARQRELLKANIQWLQDQLRDVPGVRFHAELPMFILPSTINEEQLFEKNIVISSFAYPDPTGPKIQRAVVNALHTKDDLLLLAQAIRKMVA
ncbi:MAG: aminotransferase class I/II-fold pyridoxal phosphate-dependent enzyme [Filimonas sp.]|nr:aminotransferase class I/II-fold pyridoxal phosphate-dependent enzyme [Filimonas sp.]